jgi:hypothetical protein
MKSATTGIIVALLTLSPAALATDVNPDLIPAWPETKPPKREWPDGPIKDYLHHLQRPDNATHPERDKYSRTCCDAGDTVKTKFKVEPSDARHPEDRWYAWLIRRPRIGARLLPLYRRHFSPMSGGSTGRTHADVRLRGDARGRDGGVR